MPPLRVYLDSSDFSVLSDPRRGSTDLGPILQQLRLWVENKQIICLFSGTHLSEMAPTNASFADAAQRRADLLVELCGRNVLISQDRLFAGELQFALQLVEHPPIMLSSIGEWYPEIGDIFSPGPIEIPTKNIKDIINTSGMSRKVRRIAERKAFKHGKPKAQLKATILSGARTGSLEEILQKYPMRPQDARVLSRHAVGDASAEEAMAAFEESLRDPRWMMQWFSTHHEQLSPVIEWTRKPADILLTSINEMAMHAALARKIDAELGTSLADEIYSLPKWMELQENMLVQIATKLSENLSYKGAYTLTSELINASCPGLSVGIKSLYRAWWTVTRCMPRRPKPSDFPDALHAMYAPYVDIFRADSFMAPIINQYAWKFGTQIVPKLTALIPTIHKALQDETYILNKRTLSTVAMSVHS